MKTESDNHILRSFKVGPWLVEPALNRVSRDGITNQLEIKVMDVLMCLAARAGEVVARHDIMDAVWETEIITDNTLTHAINQLRTSLGDDVKNPTFIETIHRRGYRLIAGVRFQEQGSADIARFPVPDGAAIPESETNPYPGLAAFTEEDSEFFFGREAEIAQMWRRLTSRRLLAVIGPSGVGKSSFLRAGVIPATPGSWGVMVCEPGDAPFVSLARSLVPAFADDSVAISKLIHLTEQGEAVAMVSRWRDRHSQGLLIVDQCEELFTLNPPPIQARFAELLRRLVDDADVHVLVSIRDDFLYRCHDYGWLAPLFDSLTAVKAPVGDALRRAVVEPARRLGYAFEDEELVEEIVYAVKGERGALPLVAFAVARLWDMRDRERRLLTLQAYEEIGGVSGALARHAETTLKAMGEDRVPIVRELFRNLVTAQGTRLVRTTDELLSVFEEREQLRSLDRAGELIPAREAAAEILARLCDARLLTCFEGEDGDSGVHGRVEVVHESLLASWPRLVAWRTQDADGARLRDEFRQAARLWIHRNRSVDMVWTGVAYNEYRLWRKRYPGMLSRVEEDFGRAMTAHARRRKIRRRSFAGATLLLTMILAVGFGMLWRRSVHHARRAEASELLALGAAQLDSDPNRTCASTALAYAAASLEARDSPEAREFVLRAVWGGSAGFALEDGASWMSFVANDERLVAKKEGIGVEFYNPTGGVVGRVSRDSVMSLTPTYAVITSANQDRVGLWDSDQGVVDLWSVSQERSERRLDIRRKAFPVITELGTVFSFKSNDNGITAWSWPSGAVGPASLGVTDKAYFSFYREMPRVFGVGEAIGSFNGGEVFLHNPSRWGEKPTVLGRHDRKVLWGVANRQANLVATADETGVIKIWRASEPGTAPLRILRGPRRVRSISFDASSSRLAVAGTAENASWMWDLNGPPTAMPWIFSGGDNRALTRVMLSESGLWLVSSSAAGGAGFLWPIDVGRPYLLATSVDLIGPAVFLSDGSHLVAGLRDGSVCAWPLSPRYGQETSVLLQPRAGLATSLAVQPTGKYILATGAIGAWLIPTNGRPPKQLKPPSNEISGAAFSADSRFAAAVGVEGSVESGNRVVWIWDLETGKSRTLGPFRHQSKREWQVSFAPDGSHLYTNTLGRLTQWDVSTGSSRTIAKGGTSFSISPNGQRIYIAGSSLTHEEPVVVYDLASGKATSIDSHAQATSIAVDPEGAMLVTGAPNGDIHVGRVDSSEPQVLLGHQTAAWVSVSPDGRWIASTSLDGSLRLWPTPDLSKPPLHTLPHDELIAKLKTLTNLRVVRDEETATGWKLEVGPFPGWETVPSW